ncbi:MAG: ammonium transporter [Gemmatimonadetes bacterium]|nr:ammonium transporter [Gemmatimonadota bacterium]
MAFNPPRARRVSPPTRCWHARAGTPATVARGRAPGSDTRRALWMAIEAIQFRKATALGFASGILAGLVVITPAAGVVHPVGAMLLGAVSSLACYTALKAKSRMGYDDSLDCFGIHGVGSGLGVLLLVFFTRDEWRAAQGADWSVMSQLVTQFMGLGATIGLAAVGTLAICALIQKTVGFRLPERDEKAGLDHALHGEDAYGLLNLN